MWTPLNDLSRDPHLPDDLDRLAQVARSGVFILGPQVRAFEEEFARYLGVSDCISVASGTDALRLSLRAVGVEPGGCVVMAGNAGMYAAAATVDVGANPEWIDVTESDATVDAEALGRRLAQGGVDAVVVTHLYGNMADVERIAAACRRALVPLVEDCAQAVGARYRGISAGAWGDCGAFSFYPTKNLGAMGDAGAVVTCNPNLGRSVRELRQYGWSSRYIADRPRGVNSRMDEIQSAVLRLRLQRLDDRNERRRQICRAYASALPGSARLLYVDGESGVGHLAVALLPRADARDAAIEALAGERIATGIHYPIPDHMQSAMAAWFPTGADLRVTEDLCERIVTLPCFPDLTNREVSTVAAALNRLPP